METYYVRRPQNALWDSITTEDLAADVKNRRVRSDWFIRKADDPTDRTVDEMLRMIVEQRQYYVHRNGEDFGPMSLGDIQGRIDGRDFAHDDLVWYEGSPDWKPISSMDCFSLGKTPPPVKVQNGSAESQRYAGFWLRAIAMLIDWLIALVPAYGIGYVIGLLMVSDGQHPPKETLSFVGNVLGVLLWWLYFATMESSPLQASIGKLAVGIKVTDLHDERITLGKATRRHFSKIISGLPLCAGFVAAAFTKRKQAWHDILADCLVVRR